MKRGGRMCLRSRVSWLTVQRYHGHVLDQDIKTKCKIKNKFIHVYHTMFLLFVNLNPQTGQLLPASHAPGRLEGWSGKPWKAQSHV